MLSVRFDVLDRLRRWQESLRTPLSVDGFEEQAAAAAAIVLLLGVLVVGGAPQPTSGRVIDAKLQGHQSHFYRLDLTPGEYAEISVAPRRLNGHLRLFDPLGVRLRDVDLPALPGRIKQVRILAGTAGKHGLEIASLDGPEAEGGYRLSITIHRNPSQHERQKILADQLVSCAQDLLENGGSRNEALAKLDHSAQIWDRLNDPGEEAGSLLKMGTALLKYSDQPLAALGPFNQAATLAGRSRDFELFALAEQEIAGLNAGNVWESLRHREVARSLFHAAGDSSREVDCLLAIGLTHLGMGNVEQTRKADLLALSLSRSQRNWRKVIDALERLANLHLTLGESNEVLQRLAQARSLRKSMGLSEDTFGLKVEGMAYQGLKKWQEAESRFLRSLALDSANNDKVGQAFDMNLLGFSLMRAVQNGDKAPSFLNDARKLFSRALDLAVDSHDARTIANSLGNLSIVAQAQANCSGALRFLERAQPIFQELNDRNGIAAVVLFRARCALANGEIDQALALIRKGQASAEELRQSTHDRALQVQYFSILRGFYRMQVEILMELHRQNSNGPGMGLAFEAAEASHARTLLDEIASEKSGSSPTTDPASLSEIQKSLLDPESLLLSYELGEGKSFLWLVGKSAVEVHELPPNAQIQQMVLDVTNGWSAAQGDSSVDKAAYELSRVLLGPVAAHLESKRLAIVADGALHHLSFAALPDPAQRGILLADRHEIVYLPSASVLLEQRRRVRGRARPSKEIAFFADPLYVRSGMDPAAGPQESPLVPADELREGWRSLPYSRSEVDQIQHFYADKSKIEIALGVDASVEHAKKILSSFRILHFAAHSWNDPKSPERSGLILSLYDAKGREIPGTLHPHEIYNMSLPADLVVLSACKTALGKEVDGEGILGLARAFYHAGAARVVVSLWDVGDRSTGELMKRFYEAMRVRKLPAAAALRWAQNDLRRHPEFASPYHWAGFVLQGDWS